MTLVELIIELEKLTERSVRIPGGKVILDEASLRQIIEQIRLATPDENRLSQRVASERERILSDARAQARRMVEEAQRQINARLEEQSTVQQAHERAHEIVAEAEQKANLLRDEADAYVANQLNALENRLQRLIHEVQAGQRYLVRPGNDKNPPGK